MFELMQSTEVYFIATRGRTVIHIVVLLCHALVVSGKDQMHCCFVVKLCLSCILWINVVCFSTKS